MIYRGQTVHRRGGFSLLELTAVMAIGSVLMGVAVIMLGGLLRAERAARTHLNHESAACRLAEQFRRDVRSAVTIKHFSRRQWSLQLSPNEKIAYESRPGELIRRHWKDNAVIGHESFNLWPKATAGVKLEEGSDNGTDGGRSIVVLTITGAGGRPMPVEAVLGADRRFLEPFEPRG